MDGQYVSWSNKVYVYSTAYDTQYSTFSRSGQNQPSRQGFTSEGKRYSAGTDNVRGQHLLLLQSGDLHPGHPECQWQICHSDALLTAEFDCLSSYGRNPYPAALGWESVNGNGDGFHPLWRCPGPPWDRRKSSTGSPMRPAANWSTPINPPEKASIISGAGTRNAIQTVPIDWENENDMRTMAANTTLYAGWFIPRYTTSYVLNGSGTWVDSIDYTLTTSQTSDGHTVYIYYPHEDREKDAPALLVHQSKENDRLFVDALYVCR